jgi:hypothetical protein
MIIEIIGKFLYLPIWYKGALLRTLYSISNISDLLEAGPNTFTQSTKNTNGAKERYWTKFTVYNDYNNVL